MISPAVNRICPLDNFLDVEDIELELNWGAACIAWGIGRGNPEERDAILSALGTPPTARLALIIHLSTVDPDYHVLARRMAAKKLVQEPLQDLNKWQRISMAWLLTSDPPSRGKRIHIARDVQIITTIAAIQSAGYPAGMNTATDAEASESAIAKLTVRLENNFNCTLTTDAVRKVWNKRGVQLVAAGFGGDEVSGFVERSRSLGELLRVSDVSAYGSK